MSSKRRRASLKGFRKTSSLTRMVVEQLALHYVTERDYLSKIAVEFYCETGRKREGALQQVSNILNHLKRKHLIHIVPRRLVINVPRSLYLYYINLSKEARRDSGEALRVEKYRSAIGRVAMAYQGNLGVDFPLSEASKLAEEVVVLYYNEFHGYLVALDAFTDKASILLTAINQPETNEYFNRQVLDVVSRYLLDIIAGKGLDEFIAEIIELVGELASYRLIQEVGEHWRMLSSKITALTRDPDFRTTSYARQFLKTSADADIFAALPLLNEPKPKWEGRKWELLINALLSTYS